MRGAGGASSSPVRADDEKGDENKSGVDVVKDFIPLSDIVKVRGWMQGHKEGLVRNQ